MKAKFSVELQYYRLDLAIELDFFFTLFKRAEKKVYSPLCISNTAFELLGTIRLNLIYLKFGYCIQETGKMLVDFEIGIVVMYLLQDKLDL